jgi:thiol-disulfide isomerase/thioredoxin
MGVSMDAGSDTGVRVEHVIRGSPAQHAGVLAGDRIVAVDGVNVTSAQHVTRSVASHKVGESVTLSVERAGNALSISVLLAARPSGDDMLRMNLVGAPAPEWSNVTALAGAPSTVASLKGKVTLIDFWASWCLPCRMIAPKLGGLRDRFGAQGLSVVGITTDDAEQAAVFAERHHMRYPSVVDKAGETSRAYGISGLPTVVLVDKTGVVRDVFVGFDPSADARLEATIKKLLAEPAQTAAR